MIVDILENSLGLMLRNAIVIFVNDDGLMVRNSCKKGK